jgi:hypothetical protein
MAKDNKETLKRFLGGIPLTAELYWMMRQKKHPLQARFSLKTLHETLPSMINEIQSIKHTSKVQKKKVFVFATLHYWIEQTTITALGLAADNHM